MIVTIVYVHVKEERIEEFKKLSENNHINSVRETGNLRFDVLQASDDLQRFVLYEAYRSEEDAADHKETAHYKRWRERVADMMEEPRKGIKYNIIYPEA
ncbi:MAG: antibiotic biosynthesis monooxygenase [Thermodesulfobacteriota bacterium]|nr:antibiotic biosynthesis monooxygenase [Thermodesulfobacteriota bacterium]